MIRELKWDSDFFGFPVGRIDLKESSPEILRNIGEKIRNSDFRLIYLFTPHNKDSLRNQMLKTGAFLADEKLTYRMKITKPHPEISPFVKSIKGEKMDHELEYLALESGKYSRFHMDPLIEKSKFEELYRLWMINSLNGTFADEVFVFTHAGINIGMITASVRNEEMWIGIVAVNEEFRGQGVGVSLIRAVINFCYEKGLHYLNVQTQRANKGSCTFYEKTGFSLSYTEDIYHYWNKNYITRKK